MVDGGGGFEPLPLPLADGAGASLSKAPNPPLTILICTEWAFAADFEYFLAFLTLVGTVVQPSSDTWGLGLGSLLLRQAS